MSILQILIVAVSAVFLSLLAMVTAQKMGLDIKDYKQRTKPAFLGVAAFFNLMFIVCGFLNAVLEPCLNWKVRVRIRADRLVFFDGFYCR